MRIEGKTLNAIVDLAALAADKGGCMPILGHARLSAHAGTLTVCATDLWVTATLRAACTGEDVAPVGVDVRKLKAIVWANKKATAVDVRAGEKNAVSIDVDDRSFRVIGMPGEDFPAVPTFTGADGECTVYDDPAHLADALDFALVAASHDDTRPDLCGVAFDGAWVVSTDGHRLHKANGLPPVRVQRLIPRKGVEFMRTMLASLKPVPGAVVLRFSADHAEFAVQGSGVDCVAHVKLVDAAFPPYGMIIPKRHDRAVTVRAAALSEACAMALQLASDRTSGVKLTACAPGLARDGGAPVLTVEAATPDVGEFAEHVACVESEGTGPLVIGFSGRYLKNACDGIGGVARLEFGGGELDPVAVTGNGKLAVIMPMRI